MLLEVQSEVNFINFYLLRTVTKTIIIHSVGNHPWELVSVSIKVKRENQKPLYKLRTGTLVAEKLWQRWWKSRWETKEQSEVAQRWEAAESHVQPEATGIKEGGHSWATWRSCCPALFQPHTLAEPCVRVKVLAAQSCSPPGSSVHGILQARTLEWVAIPFSRGSSRPRDQTQVSCIAGRFFTIWATRDQMTRRSRGISPVCQVRPRHREQREEGQGRHTQAEGQSTRHTKHRNKDPKWSKALHVGSGTWRSLPGILTPENKTRGNLVFDCAANEIINQNHRESLPTQVCSSTSVLFQKSFSLASLETALGRD